MTLYATSLIELGEALRQSREAMDVSVEKAASDLRIRHLYIRAIESGNWDDLPGLTYGRGYLRQYVGYLRLNQEEVMTLCDQLQGKISTELRYFDTAVTEQAPSHGVVWLSLLLAVVILVGWWWTEHSRTVSPVDPYLLTPTIERYLVMQRRQSAELSYPPQVRACLQLMRPAPAPCYRQSVERHPPVLAYKLALPLYSRYSFATPPLTKY